jgi:hypothetical protein
VSAVEAADVIRQKPAAVHEHDGEGGETVERAAQDQAGGRQGRLERIADQVVQVVAPEPLDRLEQERMQHDRRGQIGGRAPERVERAVAERPAERVGIDHGAAEPELSHREGELGRGRRRLLQRHRRQPPVAARCPAKRGGERLVLEPAPRRPLGRRQRVARDVHQRPEHRGVDALLGEKLRVQVERVEGREERACGGLVAHLQPDALARQHADAVGVRPAPGRVEGGRRDVMRVDVDDHAAVSPATPFAGRRRA